MEYKVNTNVGGAIVKQLLPRNVEELTACNGLMRLMGEDGAERPADRYARFKNDISQWYAEMDAYGLTKEEQKTLEKYMLEDHGAPSSQEILMTILMDENTCGFSLAEANAARKLVAKKQMDKIADFKKQVIERAKTPAIGKYIWHSVISSQLGYSFSRIHGYSYSLIGCQAAYMATYFPSICWNTAYLRVISGLDENNSEDTIVPINAQELSETIHGTTYEDLPDRSGKIKRTASTNYGKVAKGVGEIISHGVNVSLIDINKSGQMFEPDLKNNSILYGMKALSGVNADTIKQIEANRPYKSFEDFIERCPQNKTTMISLIKSGAFDCFGDRKEIMTKYIWSICEPKKRITMQNFAGLMDRNLIPDTFAFEKQLFNFNKALRKLNKLPGNVFKIEDNGMPFYSFFEKYFDIDLLQPQNGYLVIPEKIWKKLYDEKMAVCKKWITDNSTDLLDKLNNSLYREMWNKYAEGSISDWEMDSLGFYQKPLQLLQSSLQ